MVPRWTCREPNWVILNSMLDIPELSQILVTFHVLKPFSLVCTVLRFTGGSGEKPARLDILEMQLRYALKKSDQITIGQIRRLLCGSEKAYTSRNRSEINYDWLHSSKGASRAVVAVNSQEWLNGH